MPNYIKNPTWADGSGGATPITAAKLNNTESGIFDAHYQAAVSVYHNANQSTTTAVQLTLAFNQEIFDTESNASSTQHDTVTNNSRLVCRTAGKYLVTANVQWASNATGYRITDLYANGASVMARVNTPTNSASVNTMQSVSRLWDFAVNDYVEVIVLQNSGGALNVISSLAEQTNFSMVRVA